MKTGLTRLARGEAAMVSVTLSPLSGSGQALSKCDNNFPAVRGVFHLGLLVGAHRDAPLQGGSRTAPTWERREGGALRRVRGFFMGARHAAPLLLVLFLASPAFSATINVTANATDTLATNSSCSLREAITNINNSATTYADCAPTGAYGTSDTINIPAGTYTTAISGTGDDLNATGDYDINKNVAITGAGASTTTINGGSLDRVFHITTGGYTVFISGLTITGGYLSGSSFSSVGGGIYNYSGTLSVTNSTISGNRGSAGGGIELDNAGTLTVTNSTISSNTSTQGGGIRSRVSDTLTVTNSTINNNTSSDRGGGIYNTGTLTVTDSSITSNTATNYGGGIDGGGTITVTNSTITINTTTGYGGGIASGGTVTITNSTISDNTGSNAGGIYTGGTVTVTNSTVSDNTATTGDGGGIYNFGILSFANSTISANSASGNGGGIYAAGSGSVTVGGATYQNGTVTLSNTIVANQISGSDCYETNIGYITSSGHNLESSTTCGFTGTGDKQNKDPLLGALADNGGPTQTMALTSGSPAIDKGSCVEATDQRGTARPQGTTCDIGAYEYDGGAVATTAPTATTGAVANKTQTTVTFNGTVNANGLSTTVKFQYGTTTSYGTNTSSQTLSGSTDQAVTADVADLTCGTTYHYRVWAKNTSGTTKGSDVSFTTPGCNAPVVTTDPATNKTQTGATLNGTVNPKKDSTTVKFQYGLTSSYGSRTAAQTLTGNTDQTVSETLTGLTCDTKYYFRVRASNSSGVTKGSARTFKTSACADVP